MTQREYENAISIAQKTILNAIDLFEESFEDLKDEIAENNRIKLLRTLLKIGLLIAHTDRGRAVFLKILQFSSEIDAELAIKFWNEFDDIDNLIKKRYFKIILNAPDSNIILH